jgi:hypothetical protein
MTAAPQSLKRVEGSKAFLQLEAARETWGNQIPGTPDTLWTWCLEQHQTVLLDLLAFCTATTINAVQLKADRPGNQRLAHADNLASALSLDMKTWFSELENHERELLAHIQEQNESATDNEEMAQVLEDVVTLCEQGEFKPEIFLDFIQSGNTSQLMQYHRDYHQKAAKERGKAN